MGERRLLDKMLDRWRCKNLQKKYLDVADGTSVGSCGGLHFDRRGGRLVLFTVERRVRFGNVCCWRLGVDVGGLARRWMGMAMGRDVGCGM